MFKRYVSIIASVLLAVTMLLPATSLVALANSDVQQSNISPQAANYLVDVEVEGLSGGILKEAVQVTEGQNALDALKKALNSQSIKYTVQESDFGAYVTSIDNEEAGTLGGWDGWNYTVNGQAPSVGAAAYVLKNTDVVKFFYGRWAAMSTSTQVIEHSDNPAITVNLIGDTFTSAALETANWTVEPSNLTISTITQNTDQQITIQLKGKVERENLSLVATEAAVVGKAADALQITVVASQERVPEAIKKVTDYILSKSVSSEWTAVGLAKAGATVPESYEEVFEQNVQQQIVANLERLKITDAERLTIAAAAIGRDPKNINGIDLLDKIYNSISIRNVDTMTRQGTNGLIFALVALDTKNYEVPKDAKWNREKIVEALLSYQRADGAWSLATSNTGTASYDMTAMALIGLAPYNEQPAVKKAVEKAVTFLSESQGSTGGFNETFVGGISSEATSQVIIGLTANNIDPQGERFTKNGINLIDHLLSFQTENGGFKHTLTGSTDGMATEQAIQGLVAFDLFTKGEGRLYDFSEKSTQLEVSSHSTLQGILNDSLLKVQKNKNEIWSPIFIENTEMIEGYYVVQAGENGTKKETEIPEGTKKVFIVDNDRPYRYFDAEVVEPSHTFTVTFNREIQDSKVNLNKIYVEDITGKRVPATVKANGVTVTVTPETDYMEGQLYSLVVIDPVSAEGITIKQSARKLFIIK
ncbi:MULTISPECIES: DUF4430 domain-containing protein [unclassified Sporosarcina]|uniref:DUF4430 domain-containing protein n=1 Tax=unclassified Sporosarcina TaxID=2647733 RepID=UPI000C172F02|nr:MULTISPECIES: DUF4430 domain-containing protein [unclassified Sporosarcina]PIC98948.1 hypothetical protein CSV68_10075 [Sporosarcina sp. P29]PID05636.1 hypothetical protein CSV66_08600 [Sporosarcina sp. P30]PID08830.1 hypothetical protein CSV65_08600 [Sporosarcina sp. P31]PID11822.1 hypothetical protein CSV64_09620 [Sporosarcina sp. P32b]